MGLTKNSRDKFITYIITLKHIIRDLFGKCTLIEINNTDK